MKLSVIIVASGKSHRAGLDKLLAMLSDKSVLEYSIQAFNQCDQVGEILLVCPKERYDKLNLKDVQEKIIRRVEGGKERHNSVLAGIKKVSHSAEYIAVHDGARPLIKSRQIQAVYESALIHGAATLARPVTETLKRADDNKKISASVDRDNLWIMETPQIIRADLLHKAYQAVDMKNKKITDEVSALELIGHATYLVHNKDYNPKITYLEDLAFAEKFLPERYP